MPAPFTASRFMLSDLTLTENRCRRAATWTGKDGVTFAGGAAHVAVTEL